MNTSYPIIAVSRQFGTDGREICQALAEKLGFAFYDNEIIEMAAKESHFDPKLFERARDTSATNSFLYAINRLGAGTTYNMPISDQLFSAQSSVIRSIADSEPAVIVGRCADYVLRERPNVLSVFIQGSLEHRVKRTMEITGLTEQRALPSVKREDKRRAAYYNFYADRRWGARENYDLVLNTDILTLEQAAELLAQWARSVYGSLLDEIKG